MKLVAKWTATILVTFLTVAAAEAYVGPGAGLSAIGSALALIGAVLLMIAGFIWYPVKRLLRRKKTPETSDQVAEAADEADGEVDATNNPGIAEETTTPRPDQS